MQFTLPNSVHYFKLYIIQFFIITGKKSQELVFVLVLVGEQVFVLVGEQVFVLVVEVVFVLVGEQVVQFSLF